MGRSTCTDWVTCSNWPKAYSIRKDKNKMYLYTFLTPSAEPELIRQTFESQVHLLIFRSLFIVYREQDICCEFYASLNSHSLFLFSFIATTYVNYIILASFVTTENIGHYTSEYAIIFLCITIKAISEFIRT